MKKIIYSLSITLLVLGFFSFLTCSLMGSYVDKNGLLHEPFFLIPIGYLFIFSGLILGSVTFIISILIAKIRNN